MTVQDISPVRGRAAQADDDRLFEDFDIWLGRSIEARRAHEDAILAQIDANFDNSVLARVTAQPRRYFFDDPATVFLIFCGIFLASTVALAARAAGWF